jgi:hypothetical protein
MSPRFIAGLLFLAGCFLLPRSLAALEAPRSAGDLDGALVFLGEGIDQKIRSLGSGEGRAGVRVAVDSFYREGYVPPLGSYWALGISRELSNRENRPFDVIAEPGQTGVDYFVQGEITEIGNLVRVYTRLVRAADWAILFTWQSDFEAGPFLAELLNASPSSPRVFRDRYEVDDREHPVNLEIGAALERTIHAGDHDWFRLTSPGEGVLILETQGDMDTLMELYDGDTGFLLEEDDDSGGGGNARISYYAGKDKSFLVAARGYGEETGSYRIIARMEIAADISREPNNTRETASILELGRPPVDGFLFTLDTEDWYRVQIPAGGGVLAVYTTGDMDTLLALYDRQGTLLTEDDDSGDAYNAHISHTAGEGPLYIRVRAFEDESGPYTLHLQWEEAGGNPSAPE